MKKTNPWRTLWMAGVITALFIVVSQAFIAQAAPLAQMTPFPTPTPGPDGRILYVVKAGDTLLRISLISGVSIDELRGLNNLTGDNIFEGQELLLGLGGPSQITPTPGPSPTPTPLLPTPSPQPGFGNLCILLYADVNGDAVRQEDEYSIPDGAISTSNQAGDVSLTAQTIPGSEPHCFENLPEGNYNVTVAIPEGYNPTTASSYSVLLQAGDEIYLDFGAQVNSEAAAEAVIPGGESRSPLLGILGGTFLLAGILLAVFAGRLLRGK